MDSNCHSELFGVETKKRDEQLEDTTVFEVVSLETSVKHFTTGRTKEAVTPPGLQVRLTDLALGPRT